MRMKEDIKVALYNVMKCSARCSQELDLEQLVVFPRLDPSCGSFLIRSISRKGPLRTRSVAKKNSRLWTSHICLAALH